MRTSIRLRIACIASALLALVAGCTSNSTDGTTSSPAASASPSVVEPVTASPTATSVVSPSIVEPSSPTANSLDPTAQEAADRAAIEAQWVKFWEIYLGLARLPQSEREAALSAVAVSPFKERLIESVEIDAETGIDNYGSIKHNISWQFPVGGHSHAVIADCQDQSGSGTYDVTSGTTLSAGEPRIDLRGQFVRDDLGAWKVEDVVNLGSRDC